MRSYKNEANPDRQTGFQSACSEFSENTLSLDERLNIGDPAIMEARTERDHPLFKLEKGDLLLLRVDGARPKHNQLVFAFHDGEQHIYRAQYIKGMLRLWPSIIGTNQLDDVLIRPVVALIRELDKLLE